MKCLIIGGSGFIGTRLCANLAAAGHEVVIYDKVAPATGTTSVLADVRDPEALDAAMAGVDVIYNLAAEHRDDVRPVSLYEAVNVGGARNIVGAAERAGVTTIVFTSSVAVYGDSDKPLDENSAHNFINEYGRTKSVAEAIHLQWAEQDPRRSLTMVRPSVVFGPGNRGNVYNLLNQIASGRFIMVGDGLNRKSMAYVDNVAACLARRPPESGIQIFNYADKPDFDMNTLVSLIRAHSGRGSGVGPRLPLPLARLAGALADIVATITSRSLPISAVRVAKFIANTEVDASRVHQSGFEAPVALRDGLMATLDSEFGPRVRS